jgi:zinc/manganese transport system permease protein
MAGASLDLLYDARLMLSYPFMLHALRAGTIVAVVAGPVGYVMVLRRQTFAGHTLALAGFPGASAAVWLGISSTVGYFAFCLGAALVLSALPSAGRGLRGGSGGSRGQESAATGTVQAFALASGFLFVALYKGYSAGLTSLLFGSITAVTSGQVLSLLVAGLIGLVMLAGLGRPLVFATVDPQVADARGVPVRLVSTAWLLLLGVAAAGASQVTGSLLVFALLVAPAAAAAKLTASPARGVALSVLIALAVTWLGESIAFFSPYPIGFWVSSLAFAALLAASGYRALRRRVGLGVPG